LGVVGWNCRKEWKEEWLAVLRVFFPNRHKETEAEVFLFCNKCLLLPMFSGSYFGPMGKWHTNEFALLLLLQKPKFSWGTIFVATGIPIICFPHCIFSCCTNIVVLDHWTEHGQTLLDEYIVFSSTFTFAFFILTRTFKLHSLRKLFH